MVYRYTAEEAALMQKRINTRLDTFQRNSGRGLPAETLQQMERDRGVRVDENGDPIAQHVHLPPEPKRKQKLKSGPKRPSLEGAVAQVLEEGKKALSTDRGIRAAKRRSKADAKKPIPLEYEECCGLWKWAQLQRWQRMPISDLLIMIPNGAYLGADRGAAAVTLQKMKQAGFRPGVFDYLLPVPMISYEPARIVPGLWLEMKRVERGQVSQAQKDFRKIMRIFNWECVVAEGWFQASRVIEEYLAKCVS